MISFVRFFLLNSKYTVRDEFISLIKKISKDASEKERHLYKPPHPPDFFHQKVTLESLSDGPFPSGCGPWPLPAQSGFGICKIFHHFGMTKMAKADGYMLGVHIVW